MPAAFFLSRILKVHITSPDWSREAAVEWTDTTRTALQHRTTPGLNAQVGVEDGEPALMYTVFLHKDTISGAEQPLTGHDKFKDRLLRANVP